MLAVNAFCKTLRTGISEAGICIFVILAPADYDFFLLMLFDIRA